MAEDAQSPLPPPVGSNEVARARERFLEREPELPGGVRRVILASWQRSRESQVACDQISIPYFDEPDPSTPLLRCATPILDALNEQLQHEPVSIVLTDNSGIVLQRWVSNRDLAVRMDSVSLAAGFSYAEEYAGTNGIGTAISSGRAALVDGREHYTGQLGQFACAGAPIHHPTRGNVIGILDLTSFAHSPGSMLMALAQSTARQIEAELLARAGLRETALFNEYIKGSQKYSGPILAVNSELVMMNERMRTVLDGSEQQALIAYAGECLTADDGRPLTRTVELPSGRTAQMHGAPVTSQAGTAGWLFRIRPSERAPLVTPGLAKARRARGATSVPGMVGSSPAWVRCVEQVRVCHDAGDWITLAGEPGSGKLTVLRAVHQNRHPGAPVLVVEPPAEGELDAWLVSIAETLQVPGSLVVLAHLDRIAADLAAMVINELTELYPPDAARSVQPRIAATVAVERRDTASLGPLAAAFPRTIEVPPLRHHLDDLPELVAHLLAQLTGDSRLEMAPQTLSQLRRLDWPGNVAELKKVLSDVVRRRRSGVIEVADLPPGARAAKHRVLSQIETIERDAIIEALLANDENPARSAAALGISRATIYRKFRQYGITVPLAR